MSGEQQSRRRFVAALSLGVTALFLGARPLRGLGSLGAGMSRGAHGGIGHHPAKDWVHPDPRPGIDASKVLTSDQLGNPTAAQFYDMIREIPEMADGIRCHCGCADRPGYYSLLTCFEGGAMAQWCAICQGHAYVLYQRHKQGQTLERIRNAIDARWGDLDRLHPVAEEG